VAGPDLELLHRSADPLVVTSGGRGVTGAGQRPAGRDLDRDLGPRRIRANLIAAGPLQTRAASAIPGFDRLLDSWADRAPLALDPGDVTPVADTACFLLSDLARAITGSVVQVDAGHHAMG
jgi:meromycolic acid enoyl-[acyl-carrier-protein] reductase